ncbi:OmpA family protein [Spirillospora sp. NBC_00431]
MRALPLAVSLTGFLLVAGCADADKAEMSDPPVVGVGGGSRAAVTGFAKEGWFGSADGLHARVVIKGVERQATKAVLRYSVTSMDTTTKSVPFGIVLLDPVGRKLYKPTGSTSGAAFAPAATREMAAEYPALPPGIQKITAITPGTAGEFTGIPVTSGSPTSPPPGGSVPSGGSAPPGGFTPPTGSPPPGFSFPPGFSPPPGFSFPPGFSPPPGFSFPPGFKSPGRGAGPAGSARPPLNYDPHGASAPSPLPTTGSPGTRRTTPSTGTSPSTGTAPPVTGTAGGNPVDLYEITEGEVKDVASSDSNVTVDLRTDMLFDTGSAKLSSRAKAVLDEAAKQIKAKASGALTFTGHTDTKGKDPDNLKLSKERAEAVAKELKTRLGGGFTYTARGEGEAEPVAREGGAGDARARARNRRVEISYQVKQSPAGTTSSPVSSAAFRAQDGRTVASRPGRFGAAKRRLDVKSFYRDGAYIVAVFEIVNEGPGNTPPDASYAHQDYPGGVFSSFAIQIPGGKDVYRAVRIGPRTPNGPSGYVDPGRAVFRTGVNQPVRGFVYMPAPVGNITSVTFDAGPFGKIDKVPVS